jgi:hypothetical protein
MYVQQRNANNFVMSAAVLMTGAIRPNLNFDGAATPAGIAWIGSGDGARRASARDAACETITNCGQAASLPAGKICRQFSRIPCDRAIYIEFYATAARALGKLPVPHGQGTGREARRERAGSRQGSGRVSRVILADGGDFRNGAASSSHAPLRG